MEGHAVKLLLLITSLAAAMAANQACADLHSGLRAMDVSDYATALKELTPVAEGGDVTAQFNLAKIYLYGWGIKKNETEAAKWFRKASEQGDPKSRKMLAYMYENGMGVEKNPAEAAKLKQPPPANTASASSLPASPPIQGKGQAFIPNLAREGRGLGPSEVVILEKSLKTSHQDELALRSRLLGYYYNKAIQDMGRPATIQARRRHILWIIENKPESEIASLGEAVLVPAGHPLADREGYEQARTLWLKQIEVHSNNKSRVLLNAASFLQLHDKPLAEDILKKGESLNPQDIGWKARLGYLYGLGILGIDGLNTNGIPVSVNRAEQAGAFARKALKEVEKSNHAALIGTTGGIIEQYGSIILAMQLSVRDYGDTGEKLLLRAQIIEPKNSNWAQMLGDMYNLRSMSAKTPESKVGWTRKALEQMEKGNVEQVSDQGWRMGRLGQISKIAFNAEEFSKAEKYARELLALAEPHPADQRFGQALHDGNMVLGRLALKRGDVEKAKAYLLKAGHTPGGGTLSSFGPNMSLAESLLEHGEKSVVIEYLELCKKFWTYPRNPLNAWIQAIQTGHQPNFGQNLNY